MGRVQKKGKGSFRVVCLLRPDRGKQLGIRLGILRPQMKAPYQQLLPKIYRHLPTCTFSITLRLWTYQSSEAAVFLAGFCGTSGGGSA